jgi:photosystem II stability/assembly factor-like uncharacterized protein
MGRARQRLQTGLMPFASIVTIFLIMTAGLAEGGQAGASSPTWQVEATFSTSQGASTEGMTCASASVCYAAVYTGILKTTNAGGTWSSQSAPGDVLSVSCSSTTQCVAVGVSSGSSESSDAFVTTDGGSEWTAVLVSSSPALLAVSCVSGTSDCWAAGGGSSKVYFSSDSGETWLAQSVPSGVYSLNSIFCASTSDCVAVGYNGFSNNAIYTTDGGTMWTVSALPGSMNGYGGVFCLSTRVCIAAGGTTTNPAYIVRTTNGGVSWTLASVPSDAPAVTSVSCLSSSDCIAVGDSLNDQLDVLGSADSGATWTIQPLPDNAKDLRSIACTPAECFADGQSSESSTTDFIAGYSPGSSTLTVTTSSLPAATPGTPYSQTLAASGGTSPYTWKLVKGSHLPKGLKLDKKTGVIAGTPSTKAKSETFTVEVVDAAKDTAPATLSIEVA